MSGTARATHAPACVTIERDSEFTRYRGTRASLIEFDLADPSMFPAPGETARGERRQQAWSMAGVVNSAEYRLEIRGVARRPVSISAQRRWPERRSTTADAVALRHELLAVIEQYNALGMNTLALLEALVRPGAAAGVKPEDLSATLQHLKRVYRGLSQRNRAAIGAARCD